MEPRSRVARSAILAAILLSLGVLSLFVRLQEYGPESAIRRFHQAVALGPKGDAQLQRVTVQKVESDDVRYLENAVVEATAGGRNRFRILRTDRTPTQVRAVVAYTRPVGPLYLVWVVDRVGRNWRVNATQTTLLLPQPGNLLPLG